VPNPVAIERTVRFYSPDGEGDPVRREVVVWCPGCETYHSFTVEVFPASERSGRAEPVWSWDGNLEQPTFQPSLLCYYTVHMCPPDYDHYEVCEAYAAGECPINGHVILNADPGPGIPHARLPEEADRVYGHMRPHVVDPAYGNCHSFLHAGRWQFLGDSGHALAGQTVDMVPLPDWLLPQPDDEAG
jgi:hypothetical protein